MFYFYKNIYIKKIISKREECRHQIKGMGGVKGRVDVTRGNWVCVREGTPLREECPSHPNSRRDILLTKIQYLIEL
ncbi:hypothetical protein Hanom_Chr06g00527071 [Helianthus anomalus]